MFPFNAKTLKTIVVIFSVSIFVFGNLSPLRAAPAQSVPQYTDIKNHWAQSNIQRLASMGALGLFRGRLFYPEQPASKLEALALTMKITGFSPVQNKNASTSKKPGAPHSVARPAWETNVPAWGKPYVYLAVENGFIADPAKVSIDFDKPVTRIELARLLARVLNIAPPLNTQALVEQAAAVTENDSTGAALTDEYLVPEADRPLLRAVVDAGIMSAFPHGGFSPDQSVTRAELVSIISSLIDLGWIGNNGRQYLEGWISQIVITRKAQELELVSPSETKKYKLAGTVKCYKNGQAWPIRQAALHRCEIILDGSKQVSWINLFEQKATVAKPDKIRGSVKTLLLGNKNYLMINDLFCKDHLLPLAWDVKILEGEKAPNISSLKNGKFVDVEIYQEQVVKITLLNTKTLTDTVQRVTGGQLYLKSEVSASKPGWINHWDMARIVDKDGTPRSNVMTDDTIEVIYLDPYPKEVDDEIPLQIKITSNN